MDQGVNKKFVLLLWSFSYNVTSIPLGWEVLKMKFIPSTFILLITCLSHQSFPCFGSSTVVVDDILKSLEENSPSPHVRRKLRPKTVKQPMQNSKDPLSSIMPELGVKKGKTGNFATITTSKVNILPSEILDEDLRILLEGRKVKLLGREAHLDETYLKYAEDLKKRAEIVAKVNETNLSNGNQRVGGKPSSMRKKISGKYGVYAVTPDSYGKKISLNIMLKIYFSN